MSGFSVKKPLTVFVAVVAVLVLGVVAYLKMTPDLLPNMNFPYVIVVTAYPGASPEKVEAEVSKPMEQAMSTLEHIKQVTSTSRENASMVLLEFDESVNMDTIGVDIQQKTTALSATWDDTVAVPYVLKINPSMLPVEVAALSREGMDTIALTEFLNDTLMTKLEGIPGVARISASGMVEQELHVILDQDKIDRVNRRVANAVNGELDDAARDLEEKKDELEDSKKKISGAESQLASGQKKLVDETSKGEAMIDAKQAELEAMKAALTAQAAQLQTTSEQLQQAIDSLKKVPDLRQAVALTKAQMEEIPNIPTDPSYEKLQQDAIEAQTEDAVKQATYSAAKSVYDSEKTTYDTAKAIYDAAVATYNLAKESEETTEEELAQLKTDMDQAAADLVAPEQSMNEAKKQMDAAKALADDSAQEKTKAEAELAARSKLYTDIGLSPGEDLTVAAITAGANNAAAQAALTAIFAGLDVPEDITQSDLNAKIAELEAQKATVNSGISQLQSSLTGLAAGETELYKAEVSLQQAKTSGILQISTAAGKLAASYATIEAALQQIESGLESIEDSRADALRKADMTNVLTMEMVTQILTAQNFAMPAGYVEQDGINYMVSVGDEITELKTLENLLLIDLKMDGVDPIYLKDVALVILTDTRDETYARLNGMDSVMLSFEKQSTYATAETTNNIQSRFRQLEQEYPGLQFVSLMNQGDYIYLIVNSILNSLLLGALFAILVLWLFLRDLRPTFITLCAIPISVIFAVVLMYFSGVTINMISLSGLAVAVGMLVDNSVVVIENIYRLRAKGANVIQAAVSGAAQVAGAVTASTLTTVCVFLPIVFVEGITRQLFTDLALTMTYSLMASLIVSLTLVPAMASGMLQKEKPYQEGLLEKKILPRYEQALRWSLSNKYLVLLVSAGLLAISAAVVLVRGFIFMPAMDMPNVDVTITMPEGATMKQATKLADEVLAKISRIDGIETVGAMMGSSGSLLGGNSGDSYDVTVYITLSDDTASGAAVGRTIEEACADMACTVTASSAMLDMSTLTGSGVTMNIYAENMEVLQQAAKRAAATLRRVDGVGEVSDGLEDSTPALHIAFDRNATRRHGLTVAQVYMELADGLKDKGTVATLKLDGVSTEVIIEKPDGAVLNADELRSYVFEVEGKDGEIEKVPLKSFAVVRDTSSLTTISRLNQRRYLAVTAQVKEGSNVTLVARAAEAAMADVQLGDGVSYTFTGENESIMDAVGQLGLMLLLGVLLVYLVMVAQFQSLKSPFIVMFTIPLAFTGGFLGLLICGMEVSVISLIGFIMLTGIIVNNGIVLVDYINQLRREGADRRSAVVEAACTRMRPILMTTITTVLGLVDMAVRRSPGTALMRPIAVVCIGGLVYATLMTLLVVPCIYELLNRKEQRVISEEDLKVVDL